MMRHVFQKKRDDGEIFNVAVTIAPISGRVSAAWADKELVVDWELGKSAATWGFFVRRENGLRRKIRDQKKVSKLINYVFAYYNKQDLDVKYIEDFAGWILGEAL